MSEWGWSEQKRRQAWADEAGKPKHYVQSEGRVTYAGPSPRLCACGEYHAPRESCPAFGYDYNPMQGRHD